MTEILQHTKIFDLVRKDEVMPGFRPVGIDAPDWVIIIAERNGKFLMTRQVRWGIMKEVEEFVCGTVETGEVPVATAKRELAEETGYIVAEKDFIHLGDVYPNPAFMSNTMHMFYVNLDAAIFARVDPNPGEHERITAEWVEKDSVLECATTSGNGCACPAMKMCAISLYNART